MKNHLLNAKPANQYLYSKVKICHKNPYRFMGRNFYRCNLLIYTSILVMPVKRQPY